MTRSILSAAPVAALLAGVAPACAGAADPGERAVTADTLASGAVLVRNVAAGFWSPAEAWRIEETLRLGELDGTGPDVFGRIAQIEVDAEGTIYVFDGQLNELRVFGADGLHSWTLGGPGAGPGEFLGVIAMRFAPGGDLWLVDAMNARYTVVGRDGELETLRRPITVYGLPWLGGFDAAGWFHDQETEPDAVSTREVLHRIGADGQPVATFELPAIELPEPRAGSIRLPLPYAPRVLRSWDPAGAVWQALSSDYRLTRIGLGGDTTLIVTREARSVPLTAEQRDSIEQYVRRLEAEFNAFVPRDARPTHAPLLRWFVLDDQGHLWVCATGLEPCESLDVFDAGGRLLGTVTLPTPVLDAPRPLLRAGRFYGAVTGEHGQPQLFRGRIVRP